jgi:DNA-binding protein YbaB
MFGRVSLFAIVALIGQASVLAWQPATHPLPRPAPRSLFGGGAKDGDKKKTGGIGATVDQFKKMQEMQQKSKKMQEDLQAARLTGKSADGLTTVVVNGQATPLEATVGNIDAGADAVGKDLLEALLNANEQAKKVMADSVQELMAASGGMGMPGMPGM